MLAPGSRCQMAAPDCPYPPTNPLLVAMYSTSPLSNRYRHLGLDGSYRTGRRWTRVGPTWGVRVGGARLGKRRGATPRERARRLVGGSIALITIVNSGFGAGKKSTNRVVGENRDPVSGNVNIYIRPREFITGNFPFRNSPPIFLYWLDALRHLAFAEPCCETELSAPILRHLAQDTERLPLEPVARI